jgi:hypothetical protein
LKSPYAASALESRAWIIARWVIGHVHNETGEISAIKGVNGMVAYPEG